jgi:hypothetical protein
MSQTKSQLQATVIPQEGMLRLFQVIGCPRRNLAPLVPISESGWHRKQREVEGWPQGILISARTRLYPVSEIRDLLERLNAQGGPDLRAQRYKKAGRE